MTQLKTAANKWMIVYRGQGGMLGRTCQASPLLVGLLQPLVCLTLAHMLARCCFWARLSILLFDSLQGAPLNGDPATVSYSMSRFTQNP